MFAVGSACGALGVIPLTVHSLLAPRGVLAACCALSPLDLRCTALSLCALQLLPTVRLFPASRCFATYKACCTPFLVHPALTAQISVPVAHMARTVPSVLSISHVLAGSWCLKLYICDIPAHVCGCPFQDAGHLGAFSTHSRLRTKPSRVSAPCSVLGAQALQHGVPEGAHLRSTQPGTRAVCCVPRAQQQAGSVPAALAAHAGAD